jgi:hypothetical protein
MLVCALLVAMVGTVIGQISVPNTTAVTENFGTGSSGTTLPSNWVFHRSSSPTYSSGTGSMTAFANSGSPTTGASYMWAYGTTNKAPGVMSSSGYNSPSSIMAYYQNGGSTNITDLNITFRAPRFRRNTAAASIEVYYSTNGSSWTIMNLAAVGTPSAGTVTSNKYNFTTGADNYNYSATPTYGFDQLQASVSSLSISASSAFYLRWNLITTGSNSNGIGIDDISLTATFAAPVATSSISSTGTIDATISSLTTTQGGAAGKINHIFRLTDGSGDSKPTLVTGITFNKVSGSAVTDWTKVIAGAELTDGTNTLSTGTVNASSIVFTSIPTGSGQLGRIAEGGNS